MKLRRGLIGLFMLFFLLSGVGVTTLTIDESKDLSSRASGWAGGKGQSSLDLLVLAEKSNLWAGTRELPLQISFDPSVWSLADSDTGTLVDRRDNVIVRPFYKTNPENNLAALLGTGFLQSKKPVEVPGAVAGWKVLSGEYTFLNENKVVEIWSKGDQYLLVILPSTSLRGPVAALVQSLVMSPDIKVMGASDTDDFVKVATLSRPSVVRILTESCREVTVNASSPLSMLAGKKYGKMCNYGQGTGFFVTQDGYIATNGHVVSTPLVAGLYYGLLSGGLQDLTVDLVTILAAAKTGVAPDPAAVDQQVKSMYENELGVMMLYGLYAKLYKDKVINISDETTRHWVQLGNTSIESLIDRKAKKIVENSQVPIAKLIDKDFQEPDKDGNFKSSDVALLKVDGSNYPALPLGDAKSQPVGSGIQVIGYPGVGSGSDDYSLIDLASVTEPTITKGVINAFKEAKGNRKSLIQVDATINHGNSGGPAFDSTGKVIGLATYGLTPESGSGNYNFLRDVADLKALMEKNNVKNDVGGTYTLWKQGLESYWLSYYKWANSDISEVLKEYPAHPTAEKYIAEAGAKAGTREDATPKFTRTQRRLYLGISGGAMGVSGVAMVGLFTYDLVDTRKKRKMTQTPPRPTTPSSTPPQPPPAAPPTTPNISAPPPVQTF